MYMCTHAHVHCANSVCRKGIRYSAAGVMHGCQTPCSYYEPHVSLLQELKSLTNEQCL